MRIAIFNDNFYPELSGISDSIIDSAKEFSKMGHLVDIYAPRYSKKDFLKAGTAFKEIDLGEKIRIHRLLSMRYPMPTEQGRIVIPTSLRWMRMRENKPDIIHVHLFFGVGMEALAASRFLKVPLVGTNHTPITEFIKYGPVKGKLVEKIAKGFVSWFYNRCDFVTAPSKGILIEMKDNGFKKPSMVISNPIDIANFSPVSQEGRNDLKNKFGLSGLTLLYAGRLAAEKHVDVLIRAFATASKNIPNADFAITGHGGAEGSLKKLAEELGVGDKVKFFGTVSTEDHALIYKAADVFAVASTAEMQCISMMKAMATGLPVIGVDAWALPEYIDKKNGFVLQVGDYEGIAQKMIKLFESAELRKKLGQGGIETARKFSPEKVAKKWIGIYEKIIKDHHNE
ncbi:MAG: glycosyltransferase family 4 protein [Candidatus Moranbacteria bacterium]|nr:glycosyltransferase family 4 protein [Candidatus Moranbacteria bacterium]